MIQENLSSCAQVVPISGNDLSPLEVLKVLSEMGYKEILLEGGPSLNDSFFRLNLVSRIYLTIVPFVIGKKDLPSITGGHEEYLGFDLKKWNLVSSETLENEIFLIYENEILTRY